MSDRTFTSYPFGLTSNEETLNGLVCGDFQTTDSIYRIALISGLTGKMNSQEAHKEALNVFLKASEELSFIAADLSGTNASLAEFPYPANDRYFFDKKSEEKSQAIGSEKNENNSNQNQNQNQLVGAI